MAKTSNRKRKVRALSNTPLSDAAELYYDGETGFVPIEDARRIEKGLNESEKIVEKLKFALRYILGQNNLKHIHDVAHNALRFNTKKNEKTLKQHYE